MLDAIHDQSNTDSWDVMFGHQLEGLLAQCIDSLCRIHMVLLTLNSVML